MIKLFKRFNLLILSRYRHSTVSQWAVLIADILLFFIAFFMNEILNNNILQSGITAPMMVKLGLALMVTLVFFFVTGSYRGIIRHAGMNDILKIMISTVGPTVSPQSYSPTARQPHSTLF